MSNGDDAQQQLVQLRVLQIIVGAMTLGVTIYLGVVFFGVPPGNPAAAPGGPLLTFMACGLAGAAVVAWLVVPALATRTFRRRIAEGSWPPPDPAGNPVAARLSDATQLLAVYNVRTIIAIAILEGAAFFVTFVYQQRREPLTLSIALVLTLMIVLHLPTRARVAEWVDRQLVWLADDRQAAQLRR